MIKIRLNKPKMTQQFMLIVVVILCLNSNSPRAFVSTADEDGVFETTTTEFGENLSDKLGNLICGVARETILRVDCLHHFPVFDILKIEPEFIFADMCNFVNGFSKFFFCQVQKVFETDYPTLKSDETLMIVPINF